MSEEFLKLPEINYYTLDTTKPYLAEGQATKGGNRVKIIVPCVIMALVAVFTVAALKVLLKEPALFFVPAAMFIFAIAMLAFGLVSVKKSKKSLEENEAVLKSGYLTDGRITFYECASRRSGSGSSSNTYYDVQIEYEFIDLNSDRRVGSFKNTYSYDPEFYRGQYLMVAFNDADSLILKKFTLIAEDEEKLKKKEAQRSADNFEGLDGELLDVDTSKSVKPYAENYVWLPAAIFFSLGSVLYLSLMSALIVPQAFKSVSQNFIVSAFVVFFVYLFSLPLIIPSVLFFLQYFKRRKKYKKLFSGEIFFTYANVFASEKTYRQGNKKSVVYCYIDKWGEKRTETADSVLLQKNIDGDGCVKVVAYNAQGVSEIIKKYEISDNY